MGIDIDLNVGDIRHPTSTCYSVIEDKYIGVKTVIPISEEFRYRHQSPFRYRTFTKNSFHQLDSNPRT
jgi:hypothetical protein